MLLCKRAISHEVTESLPILFARQHIIARYVRECIDNGGLLSQVGVSDVARQFGTILIAELQIVSAVL